MAADVHYKQRIAVPFADAIQMCDAPTDGTRLPMEEAETSARRRFLADSQASRALDRGSTLHRLGHSVAQYGLRSGPCVTSIAGPNGMRNCTSDEAGLFEVSRTSSEPLACNNWRPSAPQQNAAYSITSSARARKFSGKVMPVAFAVLRLTTSL